MPLLERLMARGEAHAVPEPWDISAIAMNVGDRSYDRRELRDAAPSHRKAFLSHRPAARQNP